MQLDQIQEFFLISFCLGMAILFLWFGMILLAKEWVFSIHSKIFYISKEQFNQMNYVGMAILKLSIYIFFGIPYLSTLLLK